jgi:hypothetical protein
LTLIGVLIVVALVLRSPPAPNAQSCFAALRFPVQVGQSTYCCGDCTTTTAAAAAAGIVSIAALAFGPCLTGIAVISRRYAFFSSRRRRSSCAQSAKNVFRRFRIQPQVQQLLPHQPQSEGGDSFRTVY